MSMIEIRIPDIGDFKDIPIIEVHVQAVKPVLTDDRGHRVHELLPLGRIAQLDVAVRATHR